MTNQYTPTTEEVRERYAAIFGTDAAQGEARAQFARWLFAHDSEVRATTLKDAQEALSREGWFSPSIDALVEVDRG